MKQIVVLFFLTAFSANAQFNNPEVDAIAIQKNFSTWQNYQTQKIMLSLDFIALDENSNRISKDFFLNGFLILAVKSQS